MLEAATTARKDLEREYICDRGRGWRHASERYLSFEKSLVRVGRENGDGGAIERLLGIALQLPHEASNKEETRGNRRRPRVSTPSLLAFPPATPLILDPAGS